MIDYVDEIVAAYEKASSELDDGFTLVFKKGNRSKSSAAPDDLFVVDEDGEKLSEEGLMAFYHLVAKTLYISKCARPDVSTAAIAFLTIKAPNIADWRKLSHLMEEYLKVERLWLLILSTNGSGVLMWYFDASFAVHPNMHRHRHSHTSGGLTFCEGFSIVSSTKQKLKLNTQRSTERMPIIVVWSGWYFLTAQGYWVTQNPPLQDNKSSM